MDCCLRYSFRPQNPDHWRWLFFSANTKQNSHDCRRGNNDGTDLPTSNQCRNNKLEYMHSDVRFEVFTVVTMKNAIFWDVTSCGSCKNQCFRGKYRLCHHPPWWWRRFVSLKLRFFQESHSITTQKATFFMHTDAVQNSDVNINANTTALQTIVYFFSYTTANCKEKRYMIINLQRYLCARLPTLLMLHFCMNFFHIFPIIFY
jgi:hypothetical protein